MQKKQNAEQMDSYTLLERKLENDFPTVHTKISKHATKPRGNGTQGFGKTLKSTTSLFTISERVLPRLPPQSAISVLSANPPEAPADCSCAKSAPMYPLLEAFEDQGLFLMSPKGRRKVDGGTHYCVAVTENGDTVYSGGPQGAIRKFSVKSVNGTFLVKKEGEVNIGMASVWGLSLLEKLDKVAAVDESNIHVLSSALKIQKTISTSQLGLSGEIWDATWAGPEELFVILCGKNGCSRSVVMLNLRTKSIKWNNTLKVAIRGQRKTGGMAKCMGNLLFFTHGDPACVTVLAMESGKALKEISCVGKPRGVVAKGPFLAEVISYGL